MEVALVSLLAVIAGVVCVAKARADGALARLIRNTKTRPAGAQAEGFAEVTGTVEVDAPLQSPFSAVPCALAKWDVDVHVTQSTGMRSRPTEGAWRHRAGGVESVDFWIRDASGRILVRATRASPPSLHLSEQESSHAQPLPEPAASFLATRNVRITTNLGITSPRVRLREALVRPGARIYALGWVRRTGGVPSFVAGAGKPLLLSTFTEQELVDRIRGDASFLGVLGIVLAAGGAIGLVSLLAALR